MKKLKHITLNAHEAFLLTRGLSVEIDRPVKPQPEPDHFPMGDVKLEMYTPIVVDKYGLEQPGADVLGFTDPFYPDAWPSPVGSPGNFLWVREPWGYSPIGAILYKADYYHPPEPDAKGLYYGRRAIENALADWKSPVTMARKTSRMVVVVEKVRCTHTQSGYFWNITIKRD